MMPNGPPQTTQFGMPPCNFVPMYADMSAAAAAPPPPLQTAALKPAPAKHDDMTQEASRVLLGMRKRKHKDEPAEHESTKRQNTATDKDEPEPETQDQSDEAVWIVGDIVRVVFDDPPSPKVRSYLGVVLDTTPDSTLHNVMFEDGDEMQICRAEAESFVVPHVDGKTFNKLKGVVKKAHRGHPALKVIEHKRRTASFKAARYFNFKRCCRQMGKYVTPGDVCMLHSGSGKSDSPNKRVGHVRVMKCHAFDEDKNIFQVDIKLLEDMRMDDGKLTKAGTELLEMNSDFLSTNTDFDFDSGEFEARPQGLVVEVCSL